MTTSPPVRRSRQMPSRRREISRCRTMTFGLKPASCAPNLGGRRRTLSHGTTYAGPYFGVRRSHLSGAPGRGPQKSCRLACLIWRRFRFGRTLTHSEAARLCAVAVVLVVRPLALRRLLVTRPTEGTEDPAEEARYRVGEDARFALNDVVTHRSILPAHRCTQESGPSHVSCGC